MSEITFITGGQRSGKSRFGQRLAEEGSAHPLYLATARVWDDDFRNRIEQHRKDRGPHWQTLEEDKNLGKLNLRGKTVLLDCVTLWLTNIFHDNEFDLDTSLSVAKNEWDRFVRNDCQLIVISNELGMGIHAEHESTRKFADLQGWMNQYIAAQADRVFLMVAGIPIQVKHMNTDGKSDQTKD